MSLRLKLSKMKKLTADEHHTTMKTPEGHTITIAHRALSKPHRKALEELPFVSEKELKAFGGKVDRKDGGAIQKKPGGQHGGDVRVYVNGGGVSKDDNQPQEGGEEEAIPIASDPSQIPSIKIPEGDLPYGVKSSDLPSQPAPITPEKELPYGVTTEELSGAEPAAAAAQKRVPAQLEQEPQGSPTNPVHPETPLTQPPSYSTQVPDSGEEPTLQNAYQNLMQSSLAQAQAEAKQVHEKEQVLKTNIAAQQSIQDQYNNAHNDTMQELNHIRNDVNNMHIDPNRYLGSMDTSGKILTAIGLVLGGLAGGGKDNQALEFVNKQIERDIQAQKAEIGKKENLMTALLNQDQNIDRATNMNRLILNDLALNQLQKAEMSTQSPLIKARAQRAIGALQMQMAPMIRQENMYKMLGAVMNQEQRGLASSQDPDYAAKILPTLRMVNPKMAEDLEKRYVPTVGIAAIPVPEKAREKIIQKNELHEAINDLIKFADEHQGTVLDRATVNEGKAKALNVQAKTRESLLNTVYRESEKHLLNDLVNEDPTAFFSKFRTMPGYKVLRENNQRDLNVLKEAYKLPTKPLEPSLNDTQQAALDWARQNPNHLKAQAVFKKLGIAH